MPCNLLFTYVKILLYTVSLLFQFKHYSFISTGINVIKEQVFTTACYAISNMSFNVNTEFAIKISNLTSAFVRLLKYRF